MSVLYPAEEHLAFHYAIGSAITQWSHIEHGLFLVSLRCFSPCRPESVASGFFAIENLRSKLAFVHRVFQTSLYADEYWAEWNTLQSHVQNLAKRRNALAHGRLMIYVNAPAGRRCALVPISWDEPKIKAKEGHPPTGSICLRDIDLYSKQFSRASLRLQSLYFRMSGDEDLLGEHAQQEPQPLTLAQLRRQIYSMSPRRAKSSPE